MSTERSSRSPPRWLVLIVTRGETSVTAVTTWGLRLRFKKQKEAIRRRGGEERGYHFTDIKTSPRQVRIIDYPADMRCNLNAACWFTVVHRLIHFSLGLMQNKVTVQKWRTSLTNLVIASFTFFASLSLTIKEWGGTISSIQMWPSGLSSSALTTSEWYDGLHRPAGGSEYYLSWAQYIDTYTNFYLYL